ncbi:MAG: hypothetical protein WC072_09305 [Methanoregulaceae archaeon]
MKARKIIHNILDWATTNPHEERNRRREAMRRAEKLYGITGLPWGYYDLVEDMDEEGALSHGI